MMREEGAHGGADNALQRALRWLFARTGLLRAAEALEDNRGASIAAVLCFLAACAASWATGAPRPCQQRCTHMPVWCPARPAAPPPPWVLWDGSCCMHVPCSPPSLASSMEKWKVETQACLVWTLAATGCTC